MLGLTFLCVCAVYSLWAWNGTTVRSRVPPSIWEDLGPNRWNVEFDPRTCSDTHSSSSMSVWGRLSSIATQPYLPAFRVLVYIRVKSEGLWWRFAITAGSRGRMPGPECVSNSKLNFNWIAPSLKIGSGKWSTDHVSQRKKSRSVFKIQVGFLIKIEIYPSKKNIFEFVMIKTFE